MQFKIEKLNSSNVLIDLKIAVSKLEKGNLKKALKLLVKD